MSDVELEHAAMAPCRWIELCVSFEKQHPNDSATLCPRTTRIIKDWLPANNYLELFIIPGGRYIVSWSHDGIFVWDLGYTSNADCKLIASGGPEGVYYRCVVQATLDGMGLIILAFRRYEYCFFYEIYPQSETPQLTKIAHLDFHPDKDHQAYLLPDRVLWYSFYEEGIVFRIWDYRVNHSISFSANVYIKDLRYKVIATKRAIIVLCEEEILFWAIPPLSPQPPDFFDHNPTHIPPLFGIAFPDDIINYAEHVTWQMMSHWDSGSSQSLYFDTLRRDSKLHRFEIIVKPNLFDTSFHIINTELFPHDLVPFEYSICEDTIVACSETYISGQVYVAPRLTTPISPRPATKVLLPLATRGYNLVLCPASGRYAYIDDEIGAIVVVDLI